MCKTISIKLAKLIMVIVPLLALFTYINKNIIINLLVGIVGGVLGGWVFSLFGIAATGIMGSLVTSIVGAIFLLWIVSLLKRSDIS